jgi:transaldolase
MNFFLNTANLEELRTGSEWGGVDGVTTNPTLIAKEGTTTAQQIDRISEIVDGVSAEVISTTTDEMLGEGRHLAPDASKRRRQVADQPVVLSR